MSALKLFTPGKTTEKQLSNSTSKSDSKDHGNSESDIENRPAENSVRTRSSNTRKSKHLTGEYQKLSTRFNSEKLILLCLFSAIFSPTKASEASESETESRRSLCRGPVKRAKGKAKKAKSNLRLNNHIPKRALATAEERRCPVEDCDSIGHLGGRFVRHFTQEACPLYHNVPLSDTKAWALEREQRKEERKKAQTLFDPDRKEITAEQQAFRMKVDEIRANFIPKLPSPAHNAHLPNGKLNESKDREPDLTGLVSDFDLKLFREAQAKASEKMEAELLKFPAEGGTK